jgi:hypothetical protein
MLEVVEGDGAGIECTGFTNHVRFPGEAVVNKDAKVSYTLSRRERLVIEEKCWTYAMAKCKGTVSRFSFIHFYSSSFVPRFKGVEMIMYVKGS